MCILGEHVFGGIGPCPALRFHDDGKSACGLVEAPRLYAPVRAAIKGSNLLARAARVLTDAGIGCDGQLEGEIVSEEVRDATLRGPQTAKLRAALGWALSAWGMRG